MTKSTIAWAPVPLNPVRDGFVGRVVNAETGAPIRDASVTLEPGPSRARTDSAGIFAFPMPTRGSFTLTVRVLGLVTARDTVTIGGDGIRFSAFVALSRYINRDNVCVP